MLNIKEYMEELIELGLSKKEACCEARKELKKRKEAEKNNIKFLNDDSAWFRTKCERFKR